MANILIRFGVIFTILCVSCQAFAQSNVALSTRKADLQQLSDKLYKRDEHARQNARAFANRAGIPLRRELPNGKVIELQRAEPGSRPIFYITNNLDAADTVSTDEVHPGGSAGLNLDGGGMTVGEWDAGAVYADHWDFIGRLTQVDGATEVSGHSTHVAGTLIGSGAGLDPRSRGMAYAADLDAYDWNSDTAEMAFAASNGLLMSNHSYGIAAGWLYIGDVAPNTWWWIGGTGDEDPNFGYYDIETQLWDQIAYDAPYYLIVKASGNDRTDIGPSPGEEYTVVDQNGVPLSTEIKGTERPADCAPVGYDCLPTNSVAKNALVVGAVDDIPGGYSSFAGPSSVLMASFSSWGPTDDGRIKPDVVGNGMFLISAWPDSPYYAAAAGTSMAAPNVTGSLLLLQEHYEDINGPGNYMRAATVKALAIHTADEAGDADGPDYAFGWGLLNTKSAAEIISDNGGDHQIIEGSLADGATDSIDISVSEADSIITATLVWADPPGTPVAPSLDPPDAMLVNDLDLRVRKPPTTYLPWVLNPGVPAAAATTGDNFRDNVEQVRAVGVGTGTYTVNVSHKGALLNGENQDYSLIISVGAAPPTGSGMVIDEDFTGGLPAGWVVDTEMGISWTINTPVAGDSRLDNGTGGSGEFAMVDNNYANQTVTSLQTPPVDLSTATAVVLRFNSYYYYDTFESLNVDTSTNGGATWTNTWYFQGFNPLPTLYNLDLTGAVAGHANVMLRFRFDSEGWISGDFWQIDNVQLDAYGVEPPGGEPPGPATNPNPTDDGSGVSINTNLSWSAGTDATSHDVYFGNSPSPAFQASQSGTSFDPGTLAYSMTYYWQVDEVNADGTTSGTTWSFTTEDSPPVPPGEASNPSPADGATGESTSVSLGWSAGSGTTSHDVYFGTNPTPAFQGNQAGTSFNPGTLAGSTTYYWRVNEVNATLTTTGPVWSFTTAAASLPSFHIESINVVAEHVKGPRYRGAATITVHDEGGFAVAGVNVSGTFSGDWGGTGSGTTDSNGQLVLITPAVKNGSTWDFCVDNASKAAWDFDTSVNTGLLCAAPPPTTTGSISGIITDASNGNLIQGATASADSGQSDTTDATGSYTLNSVPTGNRTVTASATGYDAAPQSITVSEGTVSTLHFSLTPTPTGGGTGTIKGTVTSSTGAFLKSVQVQVVGGPSATTNKRGKYTIQNVPSGAQSVMAYHSSYSDTGPLPVNIVTGSTTTLNISMNP